MKRVIAAAAALLSVITILVSCASYTYTHVWYETRERMQDALPFEMRGVPDIEVITAYGVMDGRLGEIRYSVVDDYDRSGALWFRMAEPAYAASMENGITGDHGDAVSVERIGSATVSFYARGNIAAASWELGGYTYAVILSFDDATVNASRDDVYGYALSVIATGTGE